MDEGSVVTTNSVSTLDRFYEYGTLKYNELVTIGNFNLEIKIGSHFSVYLCNVLKINIGTYL